MTSVHYEGLSLTQLKFLGAIGAVGRVERTDVESFFGPFAALPIGQLSTAGLLIEDSGSLRLSDDVTEGEVVQALGRRGHGAIVGFRRLLRQWVRWACVQRRYDLAVPMTPWLEINDEVINLVLNYGRSLLTTDPHALLSALARVSARHNDVVCPSLLLLVGLALHETDRLEEACKSIRDALDPPDDRPLCDHVLSRDDESLARMWLAEHSAAARSRSPGHRRPERWNEETPDGTADRQLRLGREIFSRHLRELQFDKAGELLQDLGTLSRHSGRADDYATVNSMNSIFDIITGNIARSQVRARETLSLIESSRTVRSKKFIGIAEHIAHTSLSWCLYVQGEKEFADHLWKASLRSAEPITHSLISNLHWIADAETDNANLRRAKVEAQFSRVGLSDYFGSVVQLVSLADYAWAAGDVAGLKYCRRRLLALGAPAEARVVEIQMAAAGWRGGHGMEKTNEVVRHSILRSVDLRVMAARAVYEHDHDDARADTTMRRLAEACNRRSDFRFLRSVHTLVPGWVEDYPDWKVRRIAQFGGPLGGVATTPATDKAPMGPVGRANTLITPSEHRVLAHLAMGLTYQEVAEALSLSPHTVRTHQKSIYRKFDVHRRSEALAVARKHHLI